MQLNFNSWMNLVFIETVEKSLLGCYLPFTLSVEAPLAPLHYHDLITIAILKDCGVLELSYTFLSKADWSLFNKKKVVTTVKHLIKDPPKKGWPPYKGHSSRSLYRINMFLTSEKRTTSEIRTEAVFPKCPLFGGSTVYVNNYKNSNNM